MSERDLKYEQPSPMSRVELEEALRSGNGDRVRGALLSAFYSEEAIWVQDWCLKLAGHPEASARTGVAEVLGNIAIVRLSEVDLMKCLEAIEKLNNDPNEKVRAVAQDALQDVIHAIKLKGVS